MNLKPLSLFFLISIVAVAHAQNDTAKVHFGGQVVVWTTAQFGNGFYLQPGGRFVPELKGKFNITNQHYVDFEASLNINGNIAFEDFNYVSSQGKIKPYRVWTRFATENLEIRAGLQKINFGQAKMFRPLMWFDGMDVRDPLQLTDGVYGVLGKYFFRNNANIWLWGLIGNKQRKGWEFNATEQWKPEGGGRVEIPLLKGEVAVSTNFRKVHAVNLLSSRWNDFRILNEMRYGIDGKWDVGPGIWFESSTNITQKNQIEIPRFQNMLNIGADYTIPVGSGLGINFEYLFFNTGNELLKNGYTIHLVGSMLNYPLSIIDNVSVIFFYVPSNNLFFNYASWSRTYDNLSLYLIGFLNPENDFLFSFQSNNKNLFSGKGVQLMLSYNF